MTLKYFIAFLHILTFGFGFASCWIRAVALSKLKDKSTIQDVFKADNLWGIAAFFWLLTGLWRAFGGLEKPTEYYLGNTAFLTKMGLFALVFALELKPMITLVKWRVKVRKGEDIDFTVAPSLARISWIELGLLIPIVLMATAMARGIFY